MDSYELIKYIADSPRRTPVQVFLVGELSKIDFGSLDFFGSKKFGVLFCDLKEFEELKTRAGQHLKKIRVEADRRNSAIPLADVTKYNARIEPGAVIREKVEIGDNCVIMMGAVLNIGASIGEKTMIDMNVVIGGRAVIGKNCHIGAGAVVAGVIEPPSASPCVVGDDVLIGANAVILEGIKVGRGAVVAAGSVVVSDVEPDTVVAGVPAKRIKKVDEGTRDKTKIMEELRKL